jgi:hypothetical protein
MNGYWESLSGRVWISKAGPLKLLMPLLLAGVTDFISSLILILNMFTCVMIIIGIAIKAVNYGISVV